MHARYTQTRLTKQNIYQKSRDLITQNFSILALKEKVFILVGRLIILIMLIYLMLMEHFCACILL